MGRWVEGVGKGMNAGECIYLYSGPQLFISNK